MDADYADIAASGITVKEDRKEHVTFSDTYYTASQMIIAPAGDTAFDNCKTKADAEAVLKSFGSNVIIGVQGGTTGELYVLGEDGFEKLNCTCKSYESGAQAAADMVNGNIQYVIIDEAPAKAIAASINEG
jgi:polar amino acid transport system substrate-binding protein